MATPAARTVDTAADQAEDGLHIFCPHRELTWCGDDARRHETVQWSGSVDAICRVCLLAVEMLLDTDGPCPVCGCQSCVS
jgi:hypothetical protein